ncbi:MAG: Hsp70 family protein, partial [Phormidesmis sp. CAN_BIN36]|nr:Hsp70 family protein [Phormidesmis sp. CAN_BIN36]
SITGASTLPKDDVERMVRDAEQNASTDKERRERIDLKNQADSLAYQAEKQMSELGDKVPEADKTKVNGLVKDLREAIASEDFDKIKTMTTDLQQALYGITTNLYQQAGSGEAPDDGTTPPGTGGTTSGGGDDVIDADFTESK